MNILATRRQAVIRSVCIAETVTPAYNTEIHGQLVLSPNYCVSAGKISCHGNQISQKLVDSLLFIFHLVIFIYLL